MPSPGAKAPITTKGSAQRRGRHSPLRPRAAINSTKNKASAAAKSHGPKSRSAAAPPKASTLVEAGGAAISRGGGR